MWPAHKAQSAFIDQMLALIFNSMKFLAAIFDLNWNQTWQRCEHYDSVTGKCVCLRFKVDYLYQFWKLKRKANFNRPLVTLKRDEVDNLAQQEQDVLYRRLKLFTHLRQDLERVSWTIRCRRCFDVCLVWSQRKLVSLQSALFWDHFFLFVCVRCVCVCFEHVRIFVLGAWSIPVSLI